MPHPRDLPKASLRRFPRLSFNAQTVGWLPPLTAQVTWPNLEISELLNVSYRGFAAKMPGLFVAVPDQQLILSLELGLSPAFQVIGRVAWSDASGVGVELLELRSKGYDILTGHLEAQALAAKLKPVAPVHFAGASEGTENWFQGPNDTQVLVWRDSFGAIERVSVTMHNQTTEWYRGRPLAEYTPAQAHALLLLSQMESSTLPMIEFVRSLRAPN